jgi:uncharacterized RDD family membrane protein YckC
VTAPFLPAGLGRRLLALLYESLLLFAVLALGALPVTLALGELDGPLERALFQLYLAGLAAAYFVPQWRRGGQTLAMRAWRIRLVGADGAPLGLHRALARFLFALAGSALFGLTFAWALLDRERQFLHDRLAGTRLVHC